MDNDAKDDLRKYILRFTVVAMILCNNSDNK